MELTCLVMYEGVEDVRYAREQPTVRHGNQTLCLPYMRPFLIHTICSWSYMAMWGPRKVNGGPPITQTIPADNCKFKPWVIKARRSDQPLN